MGLVDSGCNLIPMSFVTEFNRIPFSGLIQVATESSQAEVRRILGRGPVDLSDFAALLSPGAGEILEELCVRSQSVAQQRFGKVIRMFAPLYLSNECINNCAYCGFSRDNPILRVTLRVDEVVEEARALAALGFRSVLLVAGEHPKFVSNGYIEACIEALREFVPAISLELGPMETDEYRPLVRAGAEGLVVYQETYDREVYARMHTSGPKQKFDWRLETPERAYRAGFRRLGIGALHGMADWRYEAIAMAAHAAYLLKHCWKSTVTVAVPRLRPCAGDFQPTIRLSDRDLVQIIAALRIFLPDAGIVLSTREPAKLRDGLLALGVTHASAGSHTEPGGYTGVGDKEVHQTVRGRHVPIGQVPGETSGKATRATGQFEIADVRSPHEVAQVIRSMGYEPVWKDWDMTLAG